MKQVLTSKFWLLLFVLALAGWSQTARADQPIGLIQTLCIPEPGVDYFSARLQSFNEIANYDLSYDTHQKVLEKYGLLPEDEFSYSCKLLNHTYTITGHRPPFREKGMCGGDPRISLTLRKDDETILNNVYFEPSCFSDLFHDSPHPYVESFSVQDDVNSAYIEAVVSDGMRQKTIHFGGSIHSLNHDQLSCLGEKGFFAKGKFATAQKELEPYEQCQPVQHHHHGGQ